MKPLSHNNPAETMFEFNILTMEEVAEFLNVSLKTLYRWIDAGEMPVMKLGDRTYRMFEDDLMRFIYSRRVKKKDQKDA